MENMEMDEIEKAIDSQLDFKFEFEIDIFYLKRIKKWFKMKKDGILRRK